MVKIGLAEYINRSIREKTQQNLTIQKKINIKKILFAMISGTLNAKSAICWLVVKAALILIGIVLFRPSVPMAAHSTVSYTYKCAKVFSKVSSHLTRGGFILSERSIVVGSGLILKDPDGPDPFCRPTRPNVIQNSNRENPNQGFFCFIELSPPDIESIIVLKDADATAINNSKDLRRFITSPQHWRSNARFEKAPPGC